VVGDVSVDSETLIVTLSISKKKKIRVQTDGYGGICCCTANAECLGCV